MEANGEEKSILIFIDEYLTCLLSLFKKRLKKISVPEAGSIHALLTYLSCNKVWNWNINASRNIYSIAKSMDANELERPEVFRRPVARITPTTTTTTSA
jgi:hypothetical protein